MATDRPLDEALQLTAFTCRTPMAILSLRTSEGDWRHHVRGADLEGVRLDLAFTSKVMADDTGPLVVNDTLTDPRFEDHPLVTGSPGIRAYAGIMLVSPGAGRRLGVLGIMDTRPRAWRPDIVDALTLLGRLMATQLEARSRMSAQDDLPDRGPSAGRRYDAGPVPDDARAHARLDDDADAIEAQLQKDAETHDWEGLRDRLSDVLVRIERLQRRDDEHQETG